VSDVLKQDRGSGPVVCAAPQGRSPDRGPGQAETANVSHGPNGTRPNWGRTFVRRRFSKTVHPGKARSDTGCESECRGRLQKATRRVPRVPPSEEGDQRGRDTSEAQVRIPKAVVTSCATCAVRLIAPARQTSILSFLHGRKRRQFELGAAIQTFWSRIGMSCVQRRVHDEGTGRRAQLIRLASRHCKSDPGQRDGVCLARL